MLTILQKNTWKISSYCGGGGACVETAISDESILVGDSKLHAVNVIPFSTSEWNAFATSVTA